MTMPTPSVEYGLLSPIFIVFGVAVAGVLGLPRRSLRRARAAPIVSLPRPLRRRRGAAVPGAVDPDGGAVAADGVVSPAEIRVERAERRS